MLNVKSFTSHKAYKVALISVFLALGETPQVRGSCSVPVYTPAFTGSDCAHPWRDGQAELTWAARLHTKMVYRLTVTHLSINVAPCRVTLLM